jgi:hypothetical protein
LCGREKKDIESRRRVFFLALLFWSLFLGQCLLGNNNSGEGTEKQKKRRRRTTTTTIEEEN